MSERYACRFLVDDGEACDVWSNFLPRVNDVVNLGSHGLVVVKRVEYGLPTYGDVSYAYIQAERPKDAEQ